MGWSEKQENGTPLGVILAHRGAVRLEGLSEGSSSHADRRNSNLSFFSEKALFVAKSSYDSEFPVASLEKEGPCYVLAVRVMAPHPRQSNVRFMR